MATWHRLGDTAEVLARVRFSVKVDRHCTAVFFYNVRQVRASELLDCAIDFWTIIDRHKAEMDKPMERAGRKANTLPEAEEIEEIAV